MSVSEEGHLYMLHFSILGKWETIYGGWCSSSSSSSLLHFALTAVVLVGRVGDVVVEEVEVRGAWAVVEMVKIPGVEEVAAIVEMVVIGVEIVEEMMGETVEETGVTNM